MQKGFIFKCTNKSEAECLKRQLFGSDRLAGDEVLSLQPGDKLFLLNVESDKLLGVFEAKSQGSYGLVPEAWKGRYPYQVEVRPVGEVKQLAGGKGLLSALQMNSHRLLCSFEMDALNTLFSENSHGEQSEVAHDTTTRLIKEVAKKLELDHKTNGCPVRDEKPVLASTTLWDYPTQSYGRTPKGNNKYAGVTPAFIIWNLIRRYTKSRDMVADPMCGSGTTAL